MGPNRRRLILLTLAACAAGCALLAGLAAIAVLKWGWYDVAANRQHFQLVHTALEQAMHASVRHYARGTKTPPLSDPALVRQGAALYKMHCAVCHGGPGARPETFAMSMQPVPGPLVDAARRWNDAEMYWIIRHGIKMSGMPAWEFHLAEADMWATVAFLKALPNLTPQAYAAHAGAAGAAGTAEPTGVPDPPLAQAPARPPDLLRGRVALTQYACHACHVIPGVTGSRVYVGPPLAGLARRASIAGNLPNTADGLARWIRNPQHTDPRTAMPNMGVPETDARDIAAYLQTLH